MSKKYYFEKGSLDTIKLTDFFKKYGIKLRREEQTQNYIGSSTQIAKRILYMNEKYFGCSGSVEFEEYVYDDSDYISNIITIEYSSSVEKHISYKYKLLIEEMYKILEKTKNLDLHEEFEIKEKDYITDSATVEIKCMGLGLELDKISYVFMDLFEKYFSQGA